MLRSENGELGNTTSYGTEHPPMGTENVAGMVMDTGTFFTSTVYLVKDV